jgi:hypothetical protein
MKAIAVGVDVVRSYGKGRSCIQKNALEINQERFFYLLV